LVKTIVFLVLQPQQNAELRYQISAIVQEDNALTQIGMTKILQDEGIQRSEPNISRLLRSIKITRKRLSLVPVERNSLNL